MKIIIIQTAGEHDGSTHYCKNNYLRECLSLKYAFEKCGWEVDVWGKRHKNFFNLPKFEDYDYLLNLENYEMNWLPNFEKIKGPIKIQWIIDLHVQHPTIYGLISKNMDIILHSTKSLMEKYKKLFPTKQHIWFPNGYDDRYLYNKQIERTKNMIFIGNICNRRDLLFYTKDKCNMACYNITGEQMINMINSAKINFNKSVSVDVNYRNFETLGCGTCLLTNHLDELEELGFKDGENCYMYKTEEELVKKYNLAMTDNNWKRVAKNGELFAKKHTYTERVKQLVEMLKKR